MGVQPREGERPHPSGTNNLQHLMGKIREAPFIPAPQVFQVLVEPLGISRERSGVPGGNFPDQRKSQSKTGQRVKPFPGRRVELMQIHDDVQKRHRLPQFVEEQNNGRDHVGGEELRGFTLRNALQQLIQQVLVVGGFSLLQGLQDVGFRPFPFVLVKPIAAPAGQQRHRLLRGGEKHDGTTALP